MSRVEGERQSTREAERAQQAADKKARDAKQQATDKAAFGKLLKDQKGTKEAGQQQAAQQQASRQGEAQGQQGMARKGELARAAMLARGGVMQQGKMQEQAQSFQGALSKAGQKTSQQDAGRVERREAGKTKDRGDVEERGETLLKRAETRKELKVERQQVEAREAARPNAAIGSGSERDSGGDHRGGDDGGAAALAAAKKQPQAAPAEGAKAAQPVKQIPPELLEKLVSTVYLAVTEKGLKEFQIELKDGPLKGGFLKISAEAGKVALSFSGVDANTKNLIESSKGDLMRRLEKKGLSLAKLEVR